MNILVTGGAGFIGSHTVVELVEAGHTPVIVDNFSNSKETVIDNLAKITGQPVKLYKGDYQDKKLLKQIFDKEKIEGVIHFAAYKAVGESVEKPLSYYLNNVAGLVYLLEAMDDSGVSNLVFSSSCTVYGEPDKLPIDEEAIIKPAVSPYGATKQMSETIIQDSAAASNLRALSLRYFNPIGAHPSALIGELPLGIPANLVPFVTQAAAGLRNELVVFGDDYDTPDGTNIRDYIHVVDLAAAHVKAIDYLVKQKPKFYDVFNIGTGHGSSVLEVIKTFEKTTGKKVDQFAQEYLFTPLGITKFSPDKANKMLDWSAEKSLAEALADAWRWQQTIQK